MNISSLLKSHWLSALFLLFTIPCIIGWAKYNNNICIYLSAILPVISAISAWIENLINEKKLNKKINSIEEKANKVEGAMTWK